MSSVTLYNTLTRKKEEFQSLEEGIARLYLCGPTVYDYAHIGNLRTYVSWDILGRMLKQAGHRVVETMNVTDVEDKIIANLNGKELDEFTNQYTDAFVSDLEQLNIKLPDKYENVQNYKSGLLYATHEIEAMEELIDQIWANGYAYESEGSIYFDVRKYAESNQYGVLSKVELSKQQSRIDSDEYDREEVQDFALWKAHKEGEPPFEITVNGQSFTGRPGWHIECTAMSIKNLGKTFDIHTGGVDHIFPHHENEIAQAKAANPDEDFVKYWLHAEFMLVDGKKMSKSLRNIYTLKEVSEKGFDPLDLRFLFLQTHYQSKLNFTWESLKGASEGRKNIMSSVATFEDGEQPEWVNEFLQKFHARLTDNLDTPGALAIFADFVREANRRKEPRGLRGMAQIIEEILQIGLFDDRPETPATVTELHNERELARRNKQWGEADDLRKQIEAAGWEVQDTPTQSKLVPKR